MGVRREHVQMELFRVAIEETVIDEFLIEADDRDEALDIAIQKYKEGELVLEPGNLISNQIAAVNYTTPTEWFKF